MGAQWEILACAVRAVDRCFTKIMSPATEKVRVCLSCSKNTFPTEHTDRNHFHLCWYKSQKIIFEQGSSDGILTLQGEGK